MQVKRFIAADMRRALVMVREELGEDAMIMSTQRTNKGVELVASADIDDTDVRSSGDADVQPQAQSTPHRIRNASVTPRMEPQVSSYEKESLTPASAFAAKSSPHMSTTGRFDSHSTAHRKVDKSPSMGMASGKTRDELGQELDRAREKMMAAKRRESMTLSEWAEEESERRPQSKTKPQHNMHQESSAKNNQQDDNDLRRVSDMEKKIESLLSNNMAIKTASDEKADQDIRQLKNDILSMRSLFEQQLNAMANLQKQHFLEEKSGRDIIPMAQIVKQRLNQLGVTQQCNDAVISSLKSLDSQTMTTDGLWKESLARLSHRIQTTQSDVVSEGGVFAFWGPTGVGKTTTIAKLAARHVIEKGLQDVVLITTDYFRIAAHDQLKSLGKILNVQVKTVDNLSELPRLIQQYQKKSLVLIDTPGMSHHDALLKQHLQVFKPLSNIHHILVLSATSQYQMMQSCIHSYRHLALNSCVLTKLDECASLGDGISLLAMNKLPLSYITDGQSVPEDIALMRPHQLVTKAVTLGKQIERQTSLKVVSAN